MSWGIVASIATATAAVGGAMITADGARDAASTQAAGARDAARVAEEAQLRLEGRMQPYINAGNAADYYIQGMLGLPVSVGQSSSGPTSPQLTEAELRAKYPDLAAQWDGWERKGNSQTNGHRTLWGDFTGYVRSQQGFDAIQRPQTPSTPQSQADQQAATAAARNSAMDAYEASPWAQFARESADTAERDANERFMSSAGARGSIVSGRTAAGLYDISQEAEDQRFRQGFIEGWYPSITGVSTRGYNASVGVGDSSLQTAANVGAATQNAANATAEGQRAANDSLATGVNAALYYAGQGVDAWQNRSQPTPTVQTSSSKPSRYPKAASSKYYGG